MNQLHKTEPEWMGVYREFRGKILSGELPAGATLPTISSISETAGLSPHGARRVLERLRQDGHAQSWQGKGYRVSMPSIRLKMGVSRPVFGEQLRAMGFVCSSEMASQRPVGLPPEIASQMRMRHGTTAIRTEIVRKVNDMPVALSVDYFPRKRLDGIGDTFLETNSISRSLEVHGIPEYVRDHTNLTARLPTAHEALLLSIPKNQPVYVTLGTNVDHAGDPIQVSKGIWRADCVTYEY